jgi:hypothetical protein
MLRRNAPTQIGILGETGFRMRDAVSKCWYIVAFSDVRLSFLCVDNEAQVKPWSVPGLGLMLF